jgi:uncharacterized protein
VLSSEGAGPMPRLNEIRAPSRAVVRYCAGRAFPRYRFVPGLHPHPRRDPRGHSYAAALAEPAAAFDPARWSESPEWLHGVDLFNAFYFWEAHESWEGPWAAQPRDGANALVLQGLIQIAAALLKIHLGSADGARTLSAQGLQKLVRARARAGHRRLLGLDLESTEAKFQRYFRPLSERVLPPLDESVPVLELADEPDA